MANVPNLQERAIRSACHAKVNPTFSKLLPNPLFRVFPRMCKTLGVAYSCIPTPLCTTFSPHCATTSMYWPTDPFVPAKIRESISGGRRNRRGSKERARQTRSGKTCAFARRCSAWRGDGASAECWLDGRAGFVDMCGTMEEELYDNTRLCGIRRKKGHLTL